MTNYDFRTLSPLDFELLVRDLFNAEHGSMLASFAPGPDGGVDLRGATKRWPVVVVQCKHTPDATRSSAARSAGKEATKWADQELPDAYFLATSATISPDAEREIEASLNPLPVPHDGIWHRGRLNALLTKNPQVERAHFKLWLASSEALESILSSGEWQRSEELLQRVQDRARLFVSTPAYQAAFTTLDKHNAVVITGPPGAGKSTLAEMLLLSAWRDGWTIVDVTANIEEAWARLRRTEKVIFYYDDFLGQTDVAEVGKNEIDSINRFLQRMRRGDGTQRIVLTTRDQVLAQAKSGTDDRLRRLDVEPDRAPVVLGEIGRLVRAQILFNHMHFAIEAAQARRQAASDRRYFDVIDHPNFSPRIVESATLRQSFESLDHMYSTLLAALSNPDELWLGSFHQLSSVATSVLLQLLSSPRGSMRVARLRAGLDVPDPRSWDRALKVLEGTWIRLNAVASGGVYEASLFDPSRRDFLLGLLQRDEYLERAIDLAADTDQLEFLMRMSGAKVEATSIVVDEAGSHDGYSSALLRHIDRMVSAARRCAAGELKELSTRESMGRGGSTPRWPTSSSWWRPLNHRAEVLERTASIFALGPNPAQCKWFMDQVRELIEASRSGSLASTESMFALAESIERLHVRAELDLESEVEDLVLIGVRAMENGDDVDRYWLLEDELKSERVEQAAVDAIYQALDWDREGMRQQDDVEVINSWIEETRDRAERHGVAMDLESLEEWAESRERHLVRRERLKPISPAATGNGSDTNDEVVELFARMMSGSGEEDFH